jgi:hypothetical protein
MGKLTTTTFKKLHPVNLASQMKASKASGGVATSVFIGIASTEP